MVSAAENLPTLKLANLKEMAALGAPRETLTSPPVPPPPDLPPRRRSLGKLGRGVRRARGHRSGPGARRGDAGGATRAAPEQRLRGRLSRTTRCLRSVRRRRRSRHSAPAAGAPQEWKKLAKAEVNPRWFWMVTAAAAGILVLVVAFFVVRARSASKPAAEPDAVLEQDVKDRREALEEAKKLFSAGQYDQSLAKAREVSRPQSEQRGSPQVRPDGRERHQGPAGRDGSQEAGRGSRGVGEDGARRRPPRRGARAGGRGAASRRRAIPMHRLVRDEADRKIAEAKVAAEAAARKKGAKAKDQQAKKKARWRLHRRSRRPRRRPARPPGAGTAASAPGTAASTATLHLAFDAPMPEGHVMVAVNDQILLRRPFSFKKGETHAVSASISVPPGLAARQGLALRSRHALGLRDDERATLGRRHEDAAARLLGRQARGPSAVTAGAAPGLCIKPRNRV